jgi:hypothetical protein
VDRLGHLEEGLVAADDPPVRHQPLIVEQRHHRAQQLGDPAAVRRRVDVKHPGAAQRARGAADRVDQIVGGDSPVRGQRRFSDVYDVEHGARPRSANMNVGRPRLAGHEEKSRYAARRPQERSTAPGVGTAIATVGCWAMQTVLNMVAAAILVAHGLAHLVGFVGAWRLSPQVPYKTTILAGRMDLGSLGTKIVGLLWLLLAIDFALVAWGASAGAAWWPLAAVATALTSLVLCLLAWPDAMYGAFVDAGIVILIVVWRVGVAFIARG